MIRKVEITTEMNGFHNITSEIKKIIEESKVKNGIVTIEVPHTTAGVLCMTSLDPLIREDMLREMKNIVPSRINFKHQDSPDDTAGHIKTTLFGNSFTSIILDGKLVSTEKTMGYFLAEYDGPRNRSFYVSIIEGEK